MRSIREIVLGYKPRKKTTLHRRSPKQRHDSAVYRQRNKAHMKRVRQKWVKKVRHDPRYKAKHRHH